MLSKVIYYMFLSIKLACKSRLFYAEYGDDLIQTFKDRRNVIEIVKWCTSEACNRYFRENNSKLYCMNSNVFYKINELKSIF